MSDHDWVDVAAAIVALLSVLVFLSMVSVAVAAWWSP